MPVELGGTGLGFYLWAALGDEMASCVLAASFGSDLGALFLQDSGLMPAVLNFRETTTAGDSGWL